MQNFIARQQVFMGRPTWCLILRGCRFKASNFGDRWWLPLRPRKWCKQTQKNAEQKPFKKQNQPQVSKWYALHFLIRLRPNQIPYRASHLHSVKLHFVLLPFSKILTVRKEFFWLLSFIFTATDVDCWERLIMSLRVGHITHFSWPVRHLPLPNNYSYRWL